MTNAGGVTGCDDDVVHRYVARRLAGAQLATFEVHLLTCGRCQRDVREGAALAASLDRSRLGGRADTVRRLVMWSGAVAATFVVALMIPRGSALVHLGRLESPPSFEPLAIRASVTPTDRIVDSAMTAYVERDYRAARLLLSRAATLGARGSVDFYLGAAALADGAPHAAVDPLARLLLDEASAYTADARWLLAKALIAVGRPDSAQSVLADLGDARARALSDSLRAMRAP